MSLHLTAPRRRLLALVLAATVVFIGTVWFVYDGVFWALVVAAAGLVWSSREWRAWLLAGLMVAAAPFLSSFDESGCAAWWRGRLLYKKFTGTLPYVRWRAMPHLVLGPCYEVNAPNRWMLKPQELGEEVVDGRVRRLYATDLGNLWFPPPGRHAVQALLWEMTVEKDYESDAVRLHSGDTVIDCGAHVGAFCRYALRRGAGRVIAIEPDPTNLACLEANLSQEIATGRVILVKAGVWNERSQLTLFDYPEDSFVASFVAESPGATKVEGVPVLPLDDVVEQLHLNRVDFIKMDIEGAERRALAGASHTLVRFRPRMAISSYHLPDDPVVLAETARRALPDYEVFAKDTVIRNSQITIKVLFFR